MWQENYKDCLKYIDDYWNQIIYSPSFMRLKHRYINMPLFLLTIKTKNPHIIYIPHSYFVPNTGHHRRIYYWDSYFMFRGIMGTKRQWLIRQMVDNFIYLFNQYQIIPNFNAPASVNRSQPPFLSSMILDNYLTPLRGKDTQKTLDNVSTRLYKLRNQLWFKNAMAIAKKEYEIVWIDASNSYNHHVFGYNLSRYGDRDLGYGHSSELESGWDFTSRFYNRCHQFLPIDLNTYLFKYEKDFETTAQILGNRKDEEYWHKKALERQAEMNKYMWNDQEGFFFDYGYTNQQISNYFSLAGFTPMWAGLATAKQAKKMVKHLAKFETNYGLTIGTKESLAEAVDVSNIQDRYRPAIEEVMKPKQWDYPNIWSPLEYLTVIGLLKYGYEADAKRIMEKSVAAHARAFRKHGTFFEKLDGLTGESGRGALYGDQKGFGWTNAVFFRYIMILEAMEKGSIYNENITNATPPYALSILH